MNIWNRIKSLGRRSESPVRKPVSYEEQLKTLFRSSIQLEIGGKACGRTRFGGVPDVPSDFVWPRYTLTDCYPQSDSGKIQPLSFLAQFDCAELSAFDKDGLLPDSGLLSFYYDAKYQPWECGSDDGIKVLWFEDISTLHQASVPGDAMHLPALSISMTARKSLPEWDDFAEYIDGEGDCDQFEEDRAMLGMEEVDEDNEISKLLGWPDSIQYSVFEECGGDWVLLFQLDSVCEDDFELLFGDSGRIYFCIRREDLAARRFDKTRLILQCY